MRSAVLLGKGRYADEIRGFEAEDGPRTEFITVARRIDAKVFSFATARSERSALFGRLFGRKPVIGSVVNFVMQAGSIDRCYVTGEDIGIIAAILLRLRRWQGKLYCVFHAMTPKKAKILRLIGHKMFGVFIVVSEKQRRLLIEEGNVPPEKVLTVHNWVDDRFFHPRDFARATSPGAKVVMACGAENRDYPTLVQAMKTVDADLKLFAHGFYGTHQGTVDPSAQDRIKLMPRVSFSDLLKSYQDADVIAVPLNEVDYAAGVTGLVEAMACGKVVVVSATAGLDGYLDGIDPTLLVKPHQPTDLAQAVSKALAIAHDPARQDGSRNRDWVVKHCSLDNYVQKVANLMAAT